MVTFTKDYASALEEFILARGHSFRFRAAKLGKQAKARGFGLLNILKTHEESTPRQGTQHSPIVQESRTVELPFRVSNFSRENVTANNFAGAEFTGGNCSLLELNEALDTQASSIAQAIHDDSGQFLTLAYLRLARAEQVVSPECAPYLAEIRGLFEQIEQQLRRFSHDLHPRALQEYGLVKSLDFLVQGVAERTGLRVQVSGADELELPEVLDGVLYRFVQEALNNIVRHARATDAAIDFHQSFEKLTSTVSDNGVGFNVAACKSGMGLSGIQQRIKAAAGKLSVTSRPGCGAELTMTIPLRQSRAT